MSDPAACVDIWERTEARDVPLNVRFHGKRVELANWLTARLTATASKFPGSAFQWPEYREHARRFIMDFPGPVNAEEKRWLLDHPDGQCANEDERCLLDLPELFTEDARRLMTLLLREVLVRMSCPPKS